MHKDRRHYLLIVVISGIRQNERSASWLLISKAKETAILTDTWTLSNQSALNVFPSNASRPNFKETKN